MVVALVARVVVGVTGELAAICGEVVAPGAFGVNAHPAHGPQDGLGLGGDVKVGGGHEEGEVEVSEVVIDGTSAREATGEVPAVRLQRRHFALVAGVLVAADDDGPLVLPQVEDALARHHVMSVSSQICVWYSKIDCSTPWLISAW